MSDYPFEPWEKPWIRDFRGTNRSRPDSVARGLAPATPPPSVPRGRTSPPSSASQRESAIESARAGGLKREQAAQFLADVTRARGWLPKASQAWKGFRDAQAAHRPLPPKVTRALVKHFGWTNTDRDNHNLPEIPKIIADLRPQLDVDLPVRFNPTRTKSPRSTPGHVRWIRATPWFHDDGTARGLVLLPDFFRNTADGRAKTVIHEILHTFEKPGGWDWSDVAEDDEKKQIGLLEIYKQNPASYAGFIRDLAE